MDYIKQVKTDIQGNTEERTHVAKYDVATQLEDGDQIAILRPMGNDYYKILKVDKSLILPSGVVKSPEDSGDAKQVGLVRENAGALEYALNSAPDAWKPIGGGGGGLELVMSKRIQSGYSNPGAWVLFELTEEEKAKDFNYIQYNILCSQSEETYKSPLIPKPTIQDTDYGSFHVLLGSPAVFSKYNVIAQIWVERSNLGKYDITLKQDSPGFDILYRIDVNFYKLA